ncbi:MOSC domain-containing protein [Sinorhizobium saheli]|uniref:Sulfurase n=1 Tax=Sinorhizobium saheli TaxID=36856 RepID=A0A178YB36_SINSA|nr:MOSC domain-containing protein [Sinorhizobium saheli]MQW88453.1 MOSC domain-containing protein [Sinorhizobium saheli]OAP44636.1 sulfurase [Sinorhizobium saheli]
MEVIGINIHPLKSGRAVPQTAVKVNLDGLAGDRRFMLVEPDGRFITQRELQALAQVEARHADGGVHLRMNGEELSVRFDPDRRLDVRVWSSDVNAAVADDAANAALSGWFGRPVKLVHMDEAAERFVGAEWAGTAAPVGFADGFPVLITTTGSLADLNRTLVEKGQEPVGMERFRTNILIDCQEPWEEDLWESLEIAGIAFDLVKPCARCIMTTQDQVTGERIGGNPIQGLAEKRMSADRRVAGVLFGWNAVPRGEGTVRLGDEARIIHRRAERWPMKQRPAR